MSEDFPNAHKRIWADGIGCAAIILAAAVFLLALGTCANGRPVWTCPPVGSVR